MSGRNLILVVVVALVIVSVSVGLLALFRLQQAKEFSEPHGVQTSGGMSYMVRLVEATVGKTDTGCALIVYVRLDNPNPFDITLRRAEFILVDHRRNRYLPSTTGTQSELIKLPADSVSNREMLSFTLPDDAFTGWVVLVIGQDRMLIKDGVPFNVRLRNGEFRSFRRRSW